MMHTTFDAEGNIISQEELPDVPDNAADLAAAIAAIRAQAARLSPTGATAIALYATADALEALTT